jgi:thiol-disulfide isomerase/thioredoxin
MSIRLVLICGVLSLAATGVTMAQSTASTSALPAYASDPKFQAAMKDAKEQMRRKEMNFASDAYKKANKIAGGQCVECLQGLFNAQVGAGSYKDALATTATLEAMATTPPAKAMAELMRGQALLAQGGEKPKSAQLEAADAAFKQAIANVPKAGSAHFLDGQVLAKMGKMDEAKAEFQQCVLCASPNDPARLRAQHFAEDPSLSLKKMAPAFTVTALDGSKFNLDAMGGRVVLIDFWATWCGPCNAELPHMKKIAKEFAGQPLVMISVSWDSDEAKWKDFIMKNEMTWVQYRDADHSLTKSFGIDAIPHYFTIDSDGVLTAEMLGEGSDVENKLKKLVAKAREAQKAPAVAQVAGN